MVILFFGKFVLLLLLQFSIIFNVLAETEDKHLEAFVEISKHIQEIENEVKELKLTTTNVLDLSPEEFANILKTKQQLKELRKRIQDQIAVLKDKEQEFKMKIIWLISQSLDSEIQEILTTLNNRRKKYKFVTAVRARDFKTAELIWKLLDVDIELPIIVREIYANSTDNVNLLLDFTKSLSNVWLSIVMLNTIRKELESAGHLDSFLIIKLLQTLESDILIQRFAERTQNSEAIIIHSSLLKTLKEKSMDMMTSEMLSHKFQTKSQIKKFLVDLYNLNTRLSNAVMYKAIDRVYGKIPNSEIIDYIFFQCYLPQKEDSLVYLYEEMRDTQKLDSSILKLAQVIWYIKTTDYPVEMLIARRDKDFKSMWDELPESVRNLYTSPCVRIKNKATLEYIYAASDDFSFETQLVDGFLHGKLINSKPKENGTY